MYDILIDFLDKVILRRYLRENALYYPVIIGGTALSTCIKNKLTINDIDIYYIMKKPFPTKKDIDKVKRIRDENLIAIQNDKDFQVFILKHFKDHLVNIFELYKKHPEWNVGKLFLSQIKVNGYPVIDSVIINNSNYKYYGLFSNNKNKPIPYVKVNGIKKATCSFLIKDVIRCFLYYEQLPEKNDKINAKLIRYIAKIKLLFDIHPDGIHPDDITQNTKILRLNEKYIKVENYVQTLLALIK